MHSKHLISMLIDLIDNVNNNGLLVNKTKYLYHLIFVSHLLDDTKVNESFIKEIKRIRWQNVSQEAISYGEDRFKFLKSHYEDKIKNEDSDKVM